MIINYKELFFKLFILIYFYNSFYFVFLDLFLVVLEIGEFIEFLNLEEIFVVFFNVILRVLKEVDNFLYKRKV